MAQWIILRLNPGTTNLNDLKAMLANKLEQPYRTNFEATVIEVAVLTKRDAKQVQEGADVIDKQFAERFYTVYARDAQVREE
jgi:hypothetical protein